MDEQHELSTYVLQGGVGAADRLAMLDQLCWPTTEALLAEVGLDAGQSFLDVGCGTGRVTRRVAAIVGSSGRAHGVDADADAIEIARADARADGSPATFEAGGAATHQEPTRYDIVYARFLLSHCADPLAVLRALVGLARTGGTVVVEDVHFPGHFSVPPSPAFERFVELYQVAARARGGDPLLGARLPELLAEAGLRSVGFRAHVPLFGDEPGLGFAAVTLQASKASIVSAGAASEGDVDEVIAELRRFAARPGTQMSISRVCQSFGTV